MVDCQKHQVQCDTQATEKKECLKKCWGKKIRREFNFLNDWQIDLHRKGHGRLISLQADRIHEAAVIYEQVPTLILCLYVASDFPSGRIDSRKWEDEDDCLSHFIPKKKKENFHLWGKQKPNSCRGGGGSRGQRGGKNEMTGRKEKKILFLGVLCINSWDGETARKERVHGFSKADPSLPQLISVLCLRGTCDLRFDKDFIEILFANSRVHIQK